MTVAGWLDRTTPVTRSARGAGGAEMGVVAGGAGGAGGAGIGVGQGATRVGSGGAGVGVGVGVGVGPVPPAGGVPHARLPPW